MSETRVKEKAALAVEGIKYIMSTLLIFSCCSYVAYGIVAGHAALGLHPAVNFLILVVALIFLGYLEGIQVAMLEMGNADGNTWKSTHRRAYALHMLASAGSNVECFLVGRQFCVIFVCFLISQVSTFPHMTRPEAFPEALWFVCVQMALPGALVVLPFGQLMPRLIAARHPVIFCNLPGALTVVRLCLCLEWLGVCHFSWILAGLVLKATGLDRGSGAGGRDHQSAIIDDGWRGKAAEGTLHDLMQIQTRWKNMASLGETQQFCVSLRADDPQKEGTVEPASAAGLSLFVTPAMARAGMQTGSGIDDPALLEYKKDTPKSHIYPTVKAIVAHLAKDGQDIPCFLLPPEHPQHVPPHIVAFGLMAGLVGRTERAVGA